MPPQFGKSTVIMMANVSIGLAQARRNLLKGVPLVETQTLRFSLLKGQIFASSPDRRFAETRFYASIIERRTGGSLRHGGIFVDLYRSVEILSRQVAPSGKRALVTHLYE